MTPASFVQRLALNPGGRATRVLDYLALSALGEAPSCTVMAERWGVSLATASRIIKEAKEAPIRIVVKVGA